MKLCMHKNAIFFLPVNIPMVLHVGYDTVLHGHVYMLYSGSSVIRTALFL